MTAHVGLQCEADARGTGRPLCDEPAGAQATTCEGFLRGVRTIIIRQCCDVRTEGAEARAARGSVEVLPAAGAVCQDSARQETPLQAGPPRLDDPARDTVLDAPARIEVFDLGEDLCRNRCK